MGIREIGQGIKTNLSTIRSLHQIFAPDELPDSVSALPCAVIMPASTEYDIDMPNTETSGHYICSFKIIILLSKPDLPSALSRIIDYVEITGDNSIRAAIYADSTLDSSCDDCQLKTNSGAGFTAWGGIQYLSTQFELVCLGG